MNKFFRLIKRLGTSIKKPIFMGPKGACEGQHTWTTIESIMEKSDQIVLKKLCKSQGKGPLTSLCRGNYICKKCGHIAHYNVHLNVDNLVLNLRNMDPQ